MGSCSKGTFDTDPVWSEDFSLVALTSFTIAVTLLNPPVRNFKHSSVPFFAKLHILHIFPSDSFFDQTLHCKLYYRYLAVTMP